MSEPDTIYGNYQDKYGSRNPIVRWMMGRFLRSFRQNLSHVPGKEKLTICEIGCAEGELLKQAYQVYPDANYYATDISPEEISKAEQNCEDIPIEFSVQDAAALDYDDSSFDIIICCEVLEHLTDPSAGLSELIRISRGNILVSVPNEPLWRILNMARGKYLKDFGNTPGHLNHWGTRGFQEFLLHQSKLTIKNKALPLPWQMYLLQKS